MRATRIRQTEVRLLDGSLPPTVPTHLEAEWGPRREGPEEIAARATRFFAKARSLHAMFAGPWSYDAMASESRRARPMRLDDPTAALRIVAEGEMLTSDNPPKPSPLGGYCFRGWNGQLGAKAMLFEATCGHDSTGIPNSFSLIWTPKAPLLRRMDRLIAAIGLIVDVWEPRFCWVSDLHREEAPPGFWYGREISRPEVGWLLYLAHRRVKKREVPSAFDVRPMGLDGSLIIASERPVCRAVDAERELLKSIRMQLRIRPAYVKHREP